MSIGLRSKFNCSKGYKDSSVQEVYCNLSNTEEGWGCKFLTNIQRHFRANFYHTSEAFWYGHGSFESEKVWRINKPFIKSLLQKEAEYKRVVHCPYFQIENVLKKVDELPDNILIEKDNGWEVVYKDDFIGTIIQKKPVGIKYVPKDEKSSTRVGLSFSLNDIINKHIEEKEEVNERIRFIPETTYDDIGGIDDIIDQIREVIELPLKRPDIYQHLGIKPHKGILFFGEPGNGKTLIAKAIANEVKAHFIPVNGSELISKYVGESEENLRIVFLEARELQPSIIFFDEIDSVTQRRSSEEINRHEAKFVNQLLTLMDGIVAYENVTVLASTNRPELLDEALLRPGRFDFKIEIKRPDEKGCLKILKIAAREMPLDVSLDLNHVVPLLLGSSGAEIAFIVKEAGLNALRRLVDVKNLITVESYNSLDLNKIHVTYEDFKIAVEKLKENTIK